MQAPSYLCHCAPLRTVVCPSATLCVLVSCCMCLHIGACPLHTIARPYAPLDVQRGGCIPPMAVWLPAAKGLGAPFWGWGGVGCRGGQNLYAGNHSLDDVLDVVVCCWMPLNAVGSMLDAAADAVGVVIGCCFPPQIKRRSARSYQWTSRSV